MKPTDVITLQLTASAIDRYCLDLARRSPTLEKRVAAIDTLITFISAQSDAGEQAKAEYSAIRQTLLVHFERARDALIEERAQRLLDALLRHNLQAITALYTSLSRDGFWTLLERVEPQLDAQALTALRNWADEWMARAKQHAQQANPYPDAIDFHATGIDATEYLAMTDLCHYLGVGIRNA